MSAMLQILVILKWCCTVPSPLSALLRCPHQLLVKDVASYWVCTSQGECVFSEVAIGQP